VVDFSDDSGVQFYVHFIQRNLFDNWRLIRKLQRYIIDVNEMRRDEPPSPESVDLMPFQSMMAFEHLLFGMGFKLESSPSFDIDEKTIPAAALNPLSRTADKDFHENLKAPWLDILGSYNCGLRLITIYKKAIEEFSRIIKVDSSRLEKVVMIHELAHAATHLGVDDENKIWDTFSAAKTETKEYFAQWYAYEFGAIHDIYSHQQLMYKLMRYQPKMYNTFMDDLDLGKEEMKYRLMTARKTP